MAKLNLFIYAFGTDTPYQIDIKIAAQKKHTIFIILLIDEQLIGISRLVLFLPLKLRKKLPFCLTHGMQFDFCKKSHVSLTQYKKARHPPTF